MKKLNKKILLSLSMISIIAVAFAFLHFFREKEIIQKKLPAQVKSLAHTKITPENKSIILTKSAVDELVKKAADQKYLQDVLTSGPKLPVSGHRNNPVPLQEKSPKKNKVADTTPEKSISTQTVQQQSENNKQYCFYNGHTYSIGEILQTDKGWVRCTPTILIGQDGSSQYGKSTWTLRDGLL